MTWWGAVFNVVHGAYVFAVAPLFAVAFFGSALYFIANLRRDSWAARLLRGVGPLKHRTLQDHPAICAACGYPLAEGTQCPECGASYSEPGAVLYRDELLKRRPHVPRWLTLAAIALVVTFASWLLAPAALLVGNKIEWGTTQVAEGHDSAEYTVRAAPGSPSYVVQLNTSYLVDTRPSIKAPPIDGEVYVILNDPTTNDVGWLKVDAIDRSWEFEYSRGGIQAAGFRPTSASVGVGIESGIAELYRATGFDSFWQHSQAELADLQRLGTIAIGPDFRTIEDPSSLSNEPGALEWSSNTVRRHSGFSIKAYQPMPVSDMGGVLGLLVLSIPIVGAIGYVLVRLIRR